MARNLTPAGYDAFLETLKTRIRETRIRATLPAMEVRSTRRAALDQR